MRIYYVLKWGVSTQEGCPQMRQFWLIEYLTQLPIMRSTTALPKFLERILNGFPYADMLAD